MKSEILLNKNKQAGLLAGSRIEDGGIFAQMKLLGINPDPFIEIAAHDLLKQYGNDAQTLAHGIINDFNDLGDFQAVEIWEMIREHLDSLVGSGALKAH